MAYDETLLLLLFFLPYSHRLWTCLWLFAAFQRRLSARLEVCRVMTVKGFQRYTRAICFLRYQRWEVISSWITTDQTPAMEFRKNVAFFSLIRTITCPHSLTLEVKQLHKGQRRRNCFLCRSISYFKSDLVPSTALHLLEVISALSTIYISHFLRKKFYLWNKMKILPRYPSEHLH